MSGFTTVSQNEENQRRQNEVIRGLMDGKSNNTGSVTLTANSATTVQTDYRVGVNSVLLFMGTTANAAAEQASGNMFVSSRGKQTFTITHTNNAQTDRDFEYAVIG